MRSVKERVIAPILLPLLKSEGSLSVLVIFPVVIAYFLAMAVHPF